MDDMSRWKGLIIPARTKGTERERLPSLVRPDASNGRLEQRLYSVREGIREADMQCRFGEAVLAEYAGSDVSADECGDNMARRAEDVGAGGKPIQLAALM